ncbi:hypothetical protein DUI87_17955 [Hirundo rustica rustica]|uniref:Uncharacterized protein n=1 Tax=Hirundo rustica rustica TaxID=333673 RepID=A0A3M0JUR5_HIRRU|nr:hypothetical protein DUI87_17955 [Hirundo rustica rustica]
MKIKRHSGAAPAPGANQQDSIPVPVLSPGVRVQSGMEEEEDVKEQECVFTVSARDEYLDQNIIRLYDDQGSLAVKERVNRLDKGFGSSQSCHLQDGTIPVDMPEDTNLVFCNNEN